MTLWYLISNEFTTFHSVLGENNDASCHPHRRRPHSPPLCCRPFGGGTPPPQLVHQLGGVEPPHKEEGSRFPARPQSGGFSYPTRGVVPLLQGVWAPSPAPPLPIFSTQYPPIWRGRGGSVRASKSTKSIDFTLECGRAPQTCGVDPPTQ